jgi:4-alpha-glucanotransferase
MAEAARLPRQSGVLLHPTSLPGPYPIGDLGPPARRFVDFLRAAGQQLWQVLPLGPTGYGDSPYQCFSALAGHPSLISPDDLVTDGLLEAADLPGGDAGPAAKATPVDYEGAARLKARLVARAHARFRAGIAPALRPAFEAFEAREAGWLDDAALFLALKGVHRGAPWTAWAAELRRREPAALTAVRRDLADLIAVERFGQFLFFRQWAALREHARAAGVRLVGDIPIFVALDSADAWARRELFELDADGRPAAVAGVPPDYFSADGQLWGNPLYRWDHLAQTGFRWWIERVEHLLRLVDLVRLDHFRGFAAYWAVPPGSRTARRGTWRPGPGAPLFEALRTALGGLPLIAEDLGHITPDVVALRERLGLPGMKVLQFAFGDGPGAPFLPHNLPRHCVVYTGTHDNDTSVGWYTESATPAERDFCRRYLARDGHDIAWDLIRVAWASVADTAVAPMQDLLALGSEARMNHPGRSKGNWTWRLGDDGLDPAVAARLLTLTELYSRAAPQPAPPTGAKT